MSRRVAVAESIGVAVALVLCVRMAGSQEPAGKEGARHGASQADASASEQRETVKALKREVKALQDEIARLREELAKIDQQLERLQSAPGCGAPPAGVEASKGGWDTTSSCNPPYFVAGGIKRFRAECLVSPPCDPPFSIDSDGIKHYRKDCLEPESESADDRCSPPYQLLEDGTKHFKMECL